MFHMHIADYVQQFIWPVKINSITASTIVAGWTWPTSQSAGRHRGMQYESDNLDARGKFRQHQCDAGGLRPAADPQEYYRLRFPFVWTWP